MRSFFRSFHFGFDALQIAAVGRSQNERQKLPVLQEKTRVILRGLLQGMASFQAISLFFLWLFHRLLCRLPIRAIFCVFLSTVFCILARGLCFFLLRCFRALGSSLLRQGFLVLARILRCLCCLFQAL